MSNPTIHTEPFASSLGDFVGVGPVQFDNGLVLTAAESNYARGPDLSASAVFSFNQLTAAVDPSVSMGTLGSRMLTLSTSVDGNTYVIFTSSGGFSPADPLTSLLYLRSQSAGRYASVTAKSSGGSIEQSSGLVAVSTSGWTELAATVPSLSSGTTAGRIVLQFDAGTCLNGDVFWMAAPQILKNTFSGYPIPVMSGSSLATGYSWLASIGSSGVARAASSASVTVAEPAAVACWYREGYSGAKTFAYIEPYGALGTYGSIGWSGGTLTLSTSRNLVIGPFAAFDRQLTAKEQANLRRTQNWTGKTVFGPNPYTTYQMRPY